VCVSEKKQRFSFGLRSEKNCNMLLTLLANAGTIEQPYICPRPLHEDSWRGSLKI
jgi:hypothetical protein